MCEASNKEPPPQLRRDAVFSRSSATGRQLTLCATVSADVPSLVLTVRGVHAPVPATVASRRECNAALGVGTHRLQGAWVTTQWVIDGRCAQAATITSAPYGFPLANVRIEPSPAKLFRVESGSWGRARARARASGIKNTVSRFATIIGMVRRLPLWVEYIVKMSGSVWPTEWAKPTR